MASGGQTGMIQTRSKVNPPIKGSFPLDHFQECSALASEYQKCIQNPSSRADARACKPIAKEYLACRMNNDLMAKEDFSKLGFKQQYQVQTSEPTTTENKQGKQ
jgi:cytochrome c oxidase assembly protein subunit 19